MASEIPGITDSNQDELLGLLAEAVHRIDHRTAQTAEAVADLRKRLDEMGAAWSSGGLRALRQAVTGRH